MKLLKAQSIIVVLMFILMLAVPSHNSAAAYQSGNEYSIHFNISYGIENNVKGGSFIPITVDIGSMYEGFTGTISILSPIQETENYLYSKEINVTSSGSHTTFYLPLIYQATKFQIVILDDNDNVCGSQTLNFNFNFDLEVFIGVITDDFTLYKDWKDLSMTDRNGFEMTYSAFQIDPNSLPSQTIGLDLYDIIIIDNYDTSKLSSDQIDLLFSWMEEGRYLILCTGTESDNLRGFSQISSELTLGETTEREFSILQSFDDYEQTHYTISCTYTPVQFKNSNIKYSYGNDPIIHERSYANGMLQIASISLSELTPLLLDENNYSNEVWRKIVSDSYLSKVSSKIFGGNFMDSVVTTNIANQEQLDHIPHLRNYIIILIVYVGIAIPIAYFQLKKKDKLHYIRPTIGVIAIIFSIIIFLIGSKTRFSNPFSNYIEIEQLHNTKVKTTILTGMQAPYNKEFSFEIKKDYYLTPLLATNSWTSSMSGNLANDYTVTLKEQKDSILLNFQNLVAFHPRFFKLDKEAENIDNRGIDGTIKYFDDVLSGVITNKTGAELIETFLFFNKKIVYLGNIKNNETINLNNFSTQTFINYDLDRLNELMLSNHKSGPYYNVENFSNILQLYLENYFMHAQDDAILIGFNKHDSSKPDYLVNSSYPLYGTTLTVADVAVSYEKGSYIYIPVLQQQPIINSGTFIPESNYIGGEGASLTYRLDKNLDIYKLQFSFEPLSETYKDNASQNDIFLPLPVNDILIFNNDTMVYDTFNMNNFILTKDMLKRYLNPNNELKIKYNGNSQTGSYAPVISLIGRLRDAKN